MRFRDESLLLGVSVGLALTVALLVVHTGPRAPSEPLARTAAIEPQRLVDRPHQVRTDHRHFVDDEKFEFPHQPAIAAAPNVIALNEARRKTEKRMNGLPADIDGS